MDLDVHLPGILERDQLAFARWMTVAEPNVRESLRSFVTVVDVEAVLQESLLRVWHASPRFVPDGQPNALLRFAVRIARNLAISEVRRTKARPVEDEALERMTPPAEPEEPDPMLRAKIEECYGRLPDKPKQSISHSTAAVGEQSLHRVHSLRRLHCAPRTSMRLLRRGRLRLSIHLRLS